MRRPSKPMTRRRLEVSARHHLERWSASRARLRQILERRAQRAVDEHGGDRDEVARWIEEVLDLLEAQGLLDDARLARDRARRLNERGASTRAIRARLASKGLGGEAIGAALEDLDAEAGDPDARAAAAYVRKRRMGPYRTDREAWRERDLARLARAGFGLGTALRLIDASDPDEVESIELGLDAADR